MSMSAASTILTSVGQNSGWEPSTGKTGRQHSRQCSRTNASCLRPRHVQFHRIGELPHSKNFAKCPLRKQQRAHWKVGGENTAQQLIRIFSNTGAMAFHDIYPLYNSCSIALSNPSRPSKYEEMPKPVTTPFATSARTDRVPRRSMLVICTST